jgi:hypothetical protein
MDITGRISRIMPLVTGQGRNGEWRKQEFVIEIDAGGFQRKVCFSLWGDKIEQSQLTENELVKVYFDLDSREYNQRWYTEARAWKVEKQTATETPVSTSAATPAAPPTNTSPFDEPSSDDSADVNDLPF